jgi:hypothetical protein
MRRPYLHTSLLLLLSLGTGLQYQYGNPLNAQPMESEFKSQNRKLDVAKTDDIFYGPALIIGCKQIILNPRSFTGLNEEGLVLGTQDKSFLDAKNWVSRNIFTALNRPRHNSEEKAEYCLHLFDEENKGMMGLLLTIPLGPELLGPTYREKVAELRTLMRAKVREGAKKAY